jgi:hypothetical protein
MVVIRQGKSKKYNAIPVTGRGGPLISGTSRLPHFLGNQFTDGAVTLSALGVIS